MKLADFAVLARTGRANLELSRRSAQGHQLQIPAVDLRH